MKVCIVTKTASPETGGIGRHVYELSNSLVEQGVDVTVMTRKGYSYQDLKADVVEVPFPDLGHDVLNSYSAGFNFYRKLKDIADRFDLIHGHGLVSSAYTLGNSLGVPERPFVYTLHGVSSEHVSREYLRPLARIVHSPERKTVREADRLIAVSKDAKERATEHYSIDREKIEVIYNGVDTDKFESNSGFKNRLLFVGHMNSRKGPQILLDSFIDLRKDYRDLELDLVGSGRLKQEIRQKVRDEKLEGSVHFHENISEEELIRLYSQSIFVLPSEYEGFGMVYIEAMSCSSPVIGCKTSAVPEVVEDGEEGLLVDRDVESLEKAIKKLLDDKDLRKRLAENGRKKAERFDWNNIASNTKEFYSRVIEEN